VIDIFDLWRYGRITKEFEDKLDINDEVNLENIKKYLGDNQDVVYQEIKISDKILPVAFIEGIVNVELFDDMVLKPLKKAPDINVSDIRETIYNTCHINSSVQDNISEVLSDMLNGSIAIISDEEKKAVLFDLKGFMVRGLSEPSNEAVIKGPKSAFVEALRMNTALVRRYIRSIDLKIDGMKVGNASTVPVTVIYMDSIVDKNILKLVKEQVSKIQCENILSVGEFEEKLTDKKYSIFPQALITERPDRFCSNIMEGKIGILIDGLPTAVIVPAVLNMYYQATDDYSNNYAVAGFVRVIRYACSVIALVLPAVYIAILSYHQELLNNSIALSIIKSKSEVPLSTIQEVLFLTLAFEVLVEAGIRMPKTIGQAVPIIGGLIIGDAAVSANILSPLVVIIAAITGVSGFMIPNQDFFNSIRIFRYIFIISAIFGGFFGIALCLIALIYSLCATESFGVPYFAPFAANEGKAFLSDTFFRKPG
jgi:spore germination protein KA